MRRTAAWLVACFVVAAFGSPAVPRAATDAEVKAVLLLGIAQLSEWKATLGEDEPFRICLIGASSIAQPLEAAAKREVANARPIAIERIAKAQEGIGVCQIVFVSEDAGQQFTGEVAAELATKALIVGERPGFAAGPGAINFFMEEGRVAFEVNQLHAKRAGVRLSSRILRRARIVGGERDGS